MVGGLDDELLEALAALLDEVIFESTYRS